MNPRIAYYTGHFDGPFDLQEDSKSDLFFAWKCAKSSTSSASNTLPPPKQLPVALKQSLLLWSQKADVAAQLKLVQAVGDDVSLDEIDRELVYLTAAETFFAAGRYEECFSQLRRLKASCLDG